MGKTQQTQNVCDDQKQITNKHFNSLDNNEKMSYISNGYSIVEKIKPPQEIQYYDNLPSGEDDETVCFSNSDQFRQAILNNTVILDKIIQHMENISFNKSDLIKPVKKSSGRNTEKYPIPSTMSEKVFVQLNPNYRCAGQKKSGQCVWLVKKNGYCMGCCKNNPNSVMDEETVNTAISEFKVFNKKSNWEDFVSKYFTDNQFDINVYNYLNKTPTPTTSPVSSPKKVVKKKVVKKTKAKP